MIPRHMERRLVVLDFVDVSVVAFLVLWFCGGRIRPLAFLLGLR